MAWWEWDLNTWPLEFHLFPPTPLTNFPSFTSCFEIENILIRGIPFEFGSKSQLMINLKFISLSFSSNPNPNSKLGLWQDIKVIFPSFLCYFSCFFHRVSNPYAFLCFFVFVFTGLNAIGDGSKLPWRVTDVYMFIFDIYTHILVWIYVWDEYIHRAQYLYRDPCSAMHEFFDISYGIIMPIICCRFLFHGYKDEHFIIIFLCERGLSLALPVLSDEHTREK